MLETAIWSETPALIKKYLSLVDAGDGIVRLFGYASLIDRHDPTKPERSCTLPNEYARLADMIVSMNLRTNKLYAGLEHVEGQYAGGINITIDRQDRDEALTAYLRRELGDPPWGVGVKDILRNKPNLFNQIANTSEDCLQKYKLCIVNVAVPSFDGVKSVVALAVVTNEKLPSSLVGASSQYLAKLLLEDSQSLDYFYADALEPARACGMKQVRLEEIDQWLKKRTPLANRSSRSLLNKTRGLFRKVRAIFG